MSPRRRAAAVLVAVAMAAGLLACSDDVATDEARLIVSGIVKLTPPGGATRSVDRGQDVDFGDVITVEEGTASIELSTGAIYELRAAGGSTRASTIEVASPPRLVEGEALLSDGFPATLIVGDVSVTSRGATRVSADVPAVTSFVGDSEIDGLPGATEVPEFRSLVLEADAVPRPLQIDIADPWDRRYLDDAYSMGQRLEALSLGYTADLQSAAGLDAEFFSTVLPELGRESEFTDDLLTPGRPAGETLVGAAIVLSGDEGTFRDRWMSVFSFRDAGASWGLVALSNGVSETPVIDSIELAVGASPLSDDPPLPPTTTTIPPEEPDDDVPPPSVPPPSPPSTPPPTTPPPPPTTEPEPGGVLGGVITPVAELLDDLLGVLGLGPDDPE